MPPADRKDEEPSIASRRESPATNFPLKSLRLAFQTPQSSWKNNTRLKVGWQQDHHAIRFIMKQQLYTDSGCLYTLLSQVVISLLLTMYRAQRSSRHVVNLALLWTRWLASCGRCFLFKHPIRGRQLKMGQPRHDRRDWFVTFLHKTRQLMSACAAFQIRAEDLKSSSRRIWSSR